VPRDRPWVRAAWKFRGVVAWWEAGAHRNAGRVPTAREGCQRLRARDLEVVGHLPERRQGLSKKSLSVGARPHHRCACWRSYNFVGHERELDAIEAHSSAHDLDIQLRVHLSGRNMWFSLEICASLSRAEVMCAPRLHRAGRGLRSCATKHGHRVTVRSHRVQEAVTASSRRQSESRNSPHSVPAGSGNIYLGAASSLLTRDAERGTV
jgi:hypothetical protein